MLAFLRSDGRSTISAICPSVIKHGGVICVLEGSKSWFTIFRRRGGSGRDAVAWICIVPVGIRIGFSRAPAGHVSVGSECYGGSW
jgi:hypothetical protein